MFERIFGNYIRIIYARCLKGGRNNKQKGRENDQHDGVAENVFHGKQGGEVAGTTSPYAPTEWQREHQAVQRQAFHIPP